MRLKTRLIHAGPGPDQQTGAVTVPIYPTSTYRQAGPGEHQGYEYSRTGNPTRAALEQVAAELEGGARGLAFSSGMAAISTALMLLNQGDRVVAGDDVYGGTYRVLARVFNRLGIEATFVDTSRPAEVAAAIDPRTKALLVETPSNPLLKVTDIQAMAALCRQHGLLLVVDNTFPTPYWQNPLALGADIVVHSATKYLGGHSDVVAGLLVVGSEDLGQRLHFLQNAVGGVLPPYDAWLLIRGIRTLAVRMEAHETGARRLAEWLSRHPRVRRVYYPGLPSHPGHEMARAQARGFGGMVSFEAESAALADALVRRVRIFTLAESLGAVESLISLPAKMTHASIPPERRAELGITDALVRLSVGIEDPDDLIEDLAQAVEA